MLEDGGDDSRECESRPIERVHQSRLAAFRRPITDARAPRLEIGEVAARRDLEPLPDSGREDLEIVGVRAGESGVSGRESFHAIRKLEQLKRFLGVSGEKLQLIVGTLRSRVPHELDLVELVHAKQPARVLPRRSASRRKQGE